MAIKVKAVERKLKFTKNENDPGVYRYVLGAELYTALNQKKVIREAALRISHLFVLSLLNALELTAASFVAPARKVRIKPTDGSE
jgi:hypothetical protein